MKRVIALLAVIVMSVVGCRVSAVREVRVNVPGMTTEADVQKVRAALATIGGIDKEKTVYDVQQHVVVVCYDSMLIAHKNIEIAIAEAGYDANEITAIKKKTAN